MTTTESQNSCNWKGPLGPSGPTAAPAGTPGTGCTERGQVPLEDLQGGDCSNNH